MREVSINMAELISDTTRKGDTLEHGTPSHAFSKRSTANARIMAEMISTHRLGIQSGILEIWPTALCFTFTKESKDCIKWCNRVRTRNSRKSATPRFFLSGKQLKTKTEGEGSIKG